MSVESIAYWFVALNIAAGFWLVHGMIVAEYRRRRECNPPTPSLCPDVPAIQQNAQSAQVRGYNSSELFRTDALERIQQL